ncbi:MAG TPA: glycoside hydrolase family 3 N-terminal domain-containing protein [Bacteroidales bacterium]|nr:glycoside hydrolase family 3 N-terminal domain-containing protein [Bacteroidales bacterium]HQK68169.1 glycoside hydrolase family 3 N-terminal domain-containing protein [Bacteroidales bacterium]
MKKYSSSTLFILLILLFISLPACKKWSETKKGSVRIISNKGGQTLGCDTTSGIKIITRGGFAFKDLNRNGKLDRYEDWRLSATERAKDLAFRLSIEQIAGLMLYSSHQSIPAAGTRFGGSTYGGKSFRESGAKPSDLSDQQKIFLAQDNLRHILITSVQSTETAAIWNNNVQALCESLGFGIPANNSSDPRHQAVSTAEFNVGSAGQISMWPGSLGLAATFDPAVVKQYGDIASKEYRALGITTALSPQIDLATEPRWSRVSGTFGESPELSADMARAYVDGFQTSSGEKAISGGWGYNSVNAMIKHWPGGGPEEGGRDAHYSFGKYAVYPGNNFNDHLLPFTEGALKLEGETKMASAVMPYYTISYNIDNVNNENVGNAYNKYIINDLLRGKYGFDGVICTDWGVTRDETAVDGFGTTCWGVETLSEAERHYKIIMAGVDQFGGNNDASPVIEAYKMGIAEHGEKFMRQRMEQSAVRILMNIFRVGLFENPYLDPEESKSVTGNSEFMKAGFEAQLRSIVMLKNRNKTLPLSKNKSVYIPKRPSPAGRNFFMESARESFAYPVNINVVKNYFNLTENPDEADFALVVINSPSSGNGYDRNDAGRGGNGYVPISLQYLSYDAAEARDPSIAGGDPLEKFTNRTYRGKSVIASNIIDLKMVLDTKQVMGDKPVVVVIRMSNPMVFNEFEEFVEAILVAFGVQDQAIMEIISGNAEPSGLLPVQMPSDMSTVEKQFEDVPFDMICHTDSEGNSYDFGFGLNWNGIIKDSRTEKYRSSSE